MKVLIGVDETKGTEAVFSAFDTFIKSPNEVILIHVEKLGGKSLMYDMLGEAEMSTLKEALRGTDYKAALDGKAEKLLAHYKGILERGGASSIKMVVRVGHPAEEIVRVAEEEKADLIIMGCNVKSGFQRLMSGCVTKDVERSSKIPVLVAKQGGCEKLGVEALVGREEAYDAR